MITEPKLATIGVTPTYGSGLDHLVGAGIRFATGTKDAYGKWHGATVNHAVIFVGNVDGFDKPQLMQASPNNGFEYADWDSYGADMIWLDQVGQLQSDNTLKEISLTTDQRNDIVAAAISLRGRKYDFLDILAIAKAQARLHPRDKNFETNVKKYLTEPPWWLKRIENQKRLICSQACDLAYSLANVHLFADHRVPGLVSPADLLGLHV